MKLPVNVLPCSQESRMERRGGDLNSGWSWAAEEVENWFWWETAGDTGP